MYKRLLFAALGVALAGCSSTPALVGGAPGLQVVQGDLPAPSQSDIYAPETPYLVGPYDTLTIDVFGVPELSDRELRVSAGGQIDFPLVGRLDVSGLTPGEISALVEARLREQYIRDPQVSVDVEESANRAVTVYGQVEQPGVYPVQGRTSLLKAVATARGLAEYADARDIVVFRTVNGQRLATLYNLEAISRGLYADPAIYANDIVVVGDSEARRLFEDIVGAASLVVTPLTILLQNP